MILINNFHINLRFLPLLDTFINSGVIRKFFLVKKVFTFVQSIVN
jgi:hypothetical protein